MHESDGTVETDAVAHTFRALGLTCGHCGDAVMDELSALDGVREVAVEVVKGGQSVITVVADRVLTVAEVSEALAEAGSYTLVAE